MQGPKTICGKKEGEGERERDGTRQLLRLLLSLFNCLCYFPFFYSLYNCFSPRRVSDAYLCAIFEHATNYAAT